MRWYRLLVLIVLCSAALYPAVAFDDHEFCVTARQMASAAEGDVGTWVDRTTRNAGVYVSCESRAVEFRRFTYETASAMDATWKARIGQTWSGSLCSSPLWREAVHNGWKITLNIWPANGARASFDAACPRSP